MLISQRIIAQPNFLKAPFGDASPEVSKFFPRIRRQVIEAQKFLIDDYGIFDGGKTIGELEEELFGHLTPATRKKRDKQYALYARPAFRVMTLETDKILFLVVEHSDSFWQCITITSDGTVSYFVGICTYNFADKGEKFLDIGFLSPTIQRNFTGVMERYRANPEDAGLGTTRKGIAENAALSLFYQWIVAETLMLINARNVKRISYTPSRREMGSIPKVLQKSVTYRVMDLFRERTEYVSLEDVSDQLWKPHEGKKTRAHMVRGHFKKKKNGLFWWNAFMRCRKNLEEVGEVKKTYVVYTDN